MFKKILIANRGEIACRIIMTCHQLGVQTVAVYSEIDANSSHVMMADEASCIGDASPLSSYLNIDSILSVAKRHRVEAIHPGYGFLSENVDLASQCEKAGITFIGPSPQSIIAMGSKSQAKTIMSGANVPIVPGYHGSNQAPSFLARQAEEIGYPLIIKPIAGGGGKGMRVVHQTNEFADSLASSKREAIKSFGDDIVLLERFIINPRHIEFQIFGDQHGNIVHLFERECSIQRRHQKIIEETPSPFLDDKLRTTMGTVAIKAAKAVQYTGAGTIEFIVGEDRQFFFIEMNTRLQVEHPVTEMTTGIDLVEWQLRIASGEKIPLGQEKINQKGHAIETRIYAETPHNQFLPSVGKLTHWIHPVLSSNLRMDTGVKEGDTISIHYDPMIAKLIVWDENRSQSIQRLQAALSQTGSMGVETNISFLETIARHPNFVKGEIDTTFIDSHLDELLNLPNQIPDIAIWGAAIKIWSDQDSLRSLHQEQSNETDSPWNRMDSWRLNGQGYNHLYFQDSSGKELDIEGYGEKGTYFIKTTDGIVKVIAETRSNNKFTFCYEGKRESLIILHSNQHISILHDKGRFSLFQKAHFEFEEEIAEIEGQVIAPMPGLLSQLLVSKGENVKKGQTLIILDAMKMEHPIQAPHDATIENILFLKGQLVEADDILITFKEGK